MVTRDRVYIEDDDDDVKWVSFQIYSLSENLLKNTKHASSSSSKSTLNVFVVRVQPR